MKKKFLLIIFALIFLAENSFAKSTFDAENFQRSGRKSPGESRKIAAIENWNSAEGLHRFNQSSFKEDFYQLVNFYQAQINPLYCAVATGTMLLNSLQYEKISSQKISEVSTPNGEIIPFGLYTQQSFLNEKTDKIKRREVVEYKERNFDEKYDPGLALGDFAAILEKVYRLQTDVFYITENNKRGLERFRQNLRDVLNDHESFIVVNFDGKIIGQKTNGHISPLAAYDEKTDSVLVLDTALHKNQWYFVSIEKLFAAMNSKDGNNFRGYVIVSR
jgi:hypothetical protein